MTLATTMSTADLAWALHGNVTPSTEDQYQRCLDAADAECLTIVDPYDDGSSSGGCAPVGWWPIPPGGQALYDSIVLQRSVEWWKANDAAFGAIGTTGQGLMAPTGGIDRLALALYPVKQQWGLA